MLNLRTRFSKLAEHRTQENLRRRSSSLLMGLLVRELRTVAAAVAADPTLHGAHSAVEDHRARLHAMLNLFYRRVFDTFGGRLFVHAAARRKSATKSAGVTAPNTNPFAAQQDAASEQYQQRVNQFIYKWTARKVSEISSTTQDNLKEIIANATEAGLGEEATKQYIIDEMGDIGFTRARTIARTETHSASQASVVEAAKETGIAMVKEWVSTNDDRTRPEHADADGQTVDIDEPFDVGLDKLQYPGDPNGSAEEVINCRCTSIFHDAPEAEPAAVGATNDTEDTP